MQQAVPLAALRGPGYLRNETKHVGDLVNKEDGPN